MKKNSIENQEQRVRTQEEIREDLPKHMQMQRVILTVLREQGVFGDVLQEDINDNIIAWADNADMFKKIEDLWVKRKNELEGEAMLHYLLKELGYLNLIRKGQYDEALIMLGEKD